MLYGMQQGFFRFWILFNVKSKRREEKFWRGRVGRKDTDQNQKPETRNRNPESSWQFTCILHHHHEHFYNLRPDKKIIMVNLHLKSSVLALFAAVASSLAAAETPLRVIFVNQSPDKAVELFWENHKLAKDHPDRRRLEATIPPRGGWHKSETFLGHGTYLSYNVTIICNVVRNKIDDTTSPHLFTEFSYDVEGQRHYVTPPPGNVHSEQFLMLAGSTDGYRVRCEVSVNSQQYMDYLDILVKPYWAPRAASRFLELVRNGYYDGVAFNRVVPNFLTQFGIAKDFLTRTRERELTLWDDFPKGVKFEPGTMSFAGSGHDSRTTEIFIVMPGATQQQLDKFGENTWETPFAVIEGDVEKSALKKIYSGYGDMPPYGRGPDSNRIYDVDGYTRYLPKNFPKLDYIDRCYVVNEVGDFSEGEF